MAAYDPNNIFAKILRSELPCYKVYEDQHSLVFLDIMPRCPGHALVIPKAPARNKPRQRTNNFEPTIWFAPPRLGIVDEFADACRLFS